MELIKEMKLYAKKNNIPIIEDEGLEILLQLIKENQPKRILEIGTAIGYSALLMHLESNAEIFTIERDIVRYNIAKKNLKNYTKIKIINDDALLLDNKNLGLFDFIYFDGAKSQNINFFEKYQKNLNENGIIVIDNLFFHGLLFKDENELPSKNMKQMMRKLKKFIKYAEELKGYKFEIIDKGDGIGILRRNNEIYSNAV